MANEPKAPGPPRVLVFSTLPDARRRLDLAITSSGRFTPLEFDGARREGLGIRPYAGVVDVGDGSVLDSPQLGRIRETLNGAPLIVTSNALSPERTRQLLKLGAVDWLQEPFSDVDIVRALDLLASVGGKSAMVATFVPASGGAGATTLALLAADSIARRSKTGRASVIDLDFQSANCAAYLGATSEFDIDSFVDNPDRLDHELLDLMKKVHEPRISLYSFERPGLYFHPRAREFVLRFLDLAVTKTDAILIDLPNLRTPWFADVVRHSDVTFVVSELNVPSLGRTRRLLAEIADIRGGSAGVEVVMNKAEFKLFGNVIARKDVEKMLGSVPFHTVSADQQLANDAINRGLLLSEIGSRSKLVRDAQSLFAGSLVSSR